MVEVRVLYIDIIFINGIQGLFLSTLFTRYYEWTDLFAITLRTLEFLFQVNSETLEMKTVPTGSFAVEHVVKTDGAVYLRVDVVLALDDV